VDYLLEDGFVGRASRRTARNACIGEDDVKFAKVFGEFSEKLLAVLRHRNVGAIAVRLRSQLGDRFIQCLLIATRNCDFRAFCNEKAGSGQADAAVSAGDESLLACELHDFLLDGWAVNYDDRHKWDIRSPGFSPILMPLKPPSSCH